MPTPQYIGRPCGIRTRPGRLERAVTSPEVQRSISIAKPTSCRFPAKKPAAFRLATGDGNPCPEHPWRIRFHRACSGRRRGLRYGADSRIRTGDLHLGKVAFCQLNYVRNSGGGCPPPEDHIPELLRSNWPAFPPAADPSGPASIWWGVQVTILASRGIGFTDRSASLAEYHPKFFQTQGPKSKEPGLLSLIRAPWSGTVIF